MRQVSILTILLAFLLSGCQGTKPVTSKGGMILGNDLLELELWLNRNSCVPTPGETLTFRATVTNRGKQAHKIELKEKPVLDIEIDYAVSNEERKTIRWSDGKPRTPEMMTLEFAPGESKSIEMDWVSVRPYGDSANVQAILRSGENAGDTADLGLFIGSCPGIGP